VGPYGLTIDFYNLGGADACSPEGGLFSRAFLRGPHWMTTKRLKVGDGVAKLRTLYPTARLRPGERYYWLAGYWLVERTSVIGGGASYPGEATASFVGSGACALSQGKSLLCDLEMLDQNEPGSVAERRDSNPHLRRDARPSLAARLSGRGRRFGVGTHQCPTASAEAGLPFGETESGSSRQSG